MLSERDRTASTNCYVSVEQKVAANAGATREFSSLGLSENVQAGALLLANSSAIQSTKTRTRALRWRFGR